MGGMGGIDEEYIEMTSDVDQQACADGQQVGHTALCLLLPNLKHQVTETLRPPYAAPALCAESWVSLPHEELGFKRR